MVESSMKAGNTTEEHCKDSLAAESAIIILSLYINLTIYIYNQRKAGRHLLKGAHHLEEELADEECADHVPGGRHGHADGADLAGLDLRGYQPAKGTV